MSVINIAGLTPVEDPSYRYKMPRIIAKVEGRGNGIKTVLVNAIEIGQSLNRDAPEITKFFGCEIGSQTTYDKDRAVIQGAHTAQDLQNLLCRYIEHFVLCQQCKLPETHYKIKNGVIFQKCMACGNKASVDMSHKLTTFVLAQHKKAKQAEAQGAKKEAKGKKGSKSAGEESSSPPPTEEEVNGGGKVKKEKKPKKTKESEESGSPQTTVEAVPEENPEDELDSKAVGKIHLF
jgi:translation initiation factor 5